MYPGFRHKFMSNIVLALVPNAKTIKAMKAARLGDVVTVGSIDNLLASLNADNE